MNGLMFGGIILCAFVVFTYMLLVGKSEMETEYDKKKDDEEQMQFIKKYNDSHIHQKKPPLKAALDQSLSLLKVTFLEYLVSGISIIL